MKASLTKSDKTMVPIIIGLSIVVPVVVIILMNLPTRYNLLGLDVGTFPFFMQLSMDLQPYCFFLAIDL